MRLSSLWRGAPVTSLLGSPCERLLLAGSADGAVRTLVLGHEGSVRCARARSLSTDNRPGKDFWHLETDTS